MRPGAAVALLLLSGVPHAVLAWWALGVFPALRARRRAVLAFTAVMTGLPVLGRAALEVWPSDALTAAVSVVLGEVFALLLAAGPVVIVGTIARVVAPDPPPADDPPRVGRREAIERVVGVSAFGAASVVLGWGALRGRHAFEVEEVVVRVRGWPRALDGYVIAQVSDLHVGAFVGDRELDEGLDVVRRVRPDLVVATGDLVDFVAELASPLGRRLAALAPRDGVYAILGNHDHYAGPADVADRIRAAGVRLLVNEGVHLRAGDGGGFALLGVDDLIGHRRPRLGYSGPDLDRAIRRVSPDLPRLLLAHQPSFFDDAAGKVALQLSGHTHGGQINPGVTPARLLMRYVQGRYEERGTTMWVNRGYGVVGPPSRVGAPPEITKIVIVSGP